MIPAQSSTSSAETSLTIGQLATAFNLPVSFLRQLGLEDLTGRGVGVPYRDRAGTSSRVRTRSRLEETAALAELDLAPYGLDKLDQARQAGFLLLVESEEECWILWYHRLPALALPSASALANCTRDSFPARQLCLLSGP